MSSTQPGFKNKIKCGYLPSRWKKESSLVSDVNKSQYHDTHSEDTIGNVRDTDYHSFVWSC